MSLHLDHSHHPMHPKINNYSVEYPLSKWGKISLLIHSLKEETPKISLLIQGRRNTSFLIHPVKEVKIKIKNKKKTFYIYTNR